MITLCEEGKDQNSIQSTTTPDLFDISIKKKCNWVKTYQYTCRETLPPFPQQ